MSSPLDKLKTAGFADGTPVELGGMGTFELVYSALTRKVSGWLRMG
jgi:hypothetical protein